MQAVKAYYDGAAFVPLTPVKARRNQSAIITILEDEPSKKSFWDFVGTMPDDVANEMLDALKDC
ncbi:MAG: hypothetical protein LBI19_00635 [Oscillospiraceae bacterium]|nr:hypothetical protein [Oscillospiraceae bacterium]